MLHAPASRQAGSTRNLRRARGLHQEGHAVKAFALSLCLALTACGPFIDAKRGLVSTGFLSQTQGFSGKLKTPDGATATWSVTGHDGTVVANNIVSGIGTAAVAKNVLKGLQSNNDVKAIGEKAKGAALVKGTVDPQAISGADKGAALIKGTVDPQVIPK